MAGVAITVTSPQRADFLTILKSAGPKLTKTFDGDQIIPYDLAKMFSIETRAVGCIRTLSSALVLLGTKTQRCVIRGQFIGDARAQAIAPPARPGMYPRTNDLFEEVPHHWRCDDIDRFEPLIADPVGDPEGAIRELIETVYPPEFHNASYHWQLSSSHGRKPNELKVHLWWWLATPYTGPQHKAWVRANELPIDVAPLRKVQVHYTANPVFINGARDPVARRSGLYRGEVDAVPLVIPQALLDSADVATHTDQGDELDLVDPTQKPGLIGAFCREYPISRVIEELLPDEFQYAIGSDRRVTWLNSGGGAPEGCFVTDDDWYLGNTHNSDPFDGRLANAWDLVRVFKFGGKDKDLDDDDRALCGVANLPSQRAMLTWAETCPGVNGVAEAATQSARDGFLASIRAAANEQVLRQEVLPAIAAATPRMGKADLGILLVAIKDRVTFFTGVRVGIPLIKGMLRDAARAGDEVDREDVPFWCKPWVYVTGGDQFFNLDTKEKMTRQGFDFAFQRFMTPFMDGDGVVPHASHFAANTWHMRTVAGIWYLPTSPQVFEMNELMWANSYTDRGMPAIPPVMTDAEVAAVQAFEEHGKLLIPDDRERGLLLDWLSYNARHTGKKINWAVFLHGVPGCGKSLYSALLSAVLGNQNVYSPDANEITTSNFTAWATGRAVIAIEEVKMHGHNAFDVANKLKAFITNPSVSIHAKGKDSFDVVNCTNYILYSNYLDGVPQEKGDRRYFTLSSAIDEEASERLTEQGHFDRLFEAINCHPGALRKWLVERPMGAEFNPTGRAPKTAAKDMAIELSKSDMQLVFEDLIESGGKGITKTVISSSHLTHAIKEKTGRDVYTTTVQKILTGAGYSCYGRLKWDGDMRRIWTRGWKVEKDADSNAKLREHLALSGDEFDFLE